MKTALRLPRGLHAKLHESALGVGRSYNAEILHRLEQSFEVETDDGMIRTLQQKIDELEVALERLNASREALESTLARMGADENFLARMEKAFSQVIAMTEGGSKPKGPPQQKKRG